MQTIAGYTAFQRQAAREGLAEHEGCCTPGARCWMAAGLENIISSTRLAQDVHPDADRPLPRGNGTTTTARGSAERLATDAQMKFVNFLLSQLDNPADGRVNVVYKTTMEIIDADTRTHGGLLFTRVSSILTALKQATAEQRAAMARTAPTAVRTVSAKAPRAEMSEGMYELDGKIYRVKLSNAGRLYAMLLVITDGVGGFEWAEGMMRTLRPEHRMTLDRASELSVRYHFCVRCAKELTKKSSIAQGMGDTCASKM